jgi:hypothetical protein
MAQQTAVELLHEKSNELITQYLDNKITKRDLITMHHNILYPHKEIEKEQIINACEHFADYPFNEQDYKQYYNETYNK